MLEDANYCQSLRQLLKQNSIEIKKKCATFSVLLGPEYAFDHINLCVAFCPELPFRHYKFQISKEGDIPLKQHRGFCCRRHRVGQELVWYCPELRVAHAPGIPGRFPRHRVLPIP